MNWNKGIGTSPGDSGHGQIVIITARWILILGALVLTLWNPTPPEALWMVQVQTGLLLIYAVANFFLHAQYIRQRSDLPVVAYVTSVIDIALITFVIALQPSSIGSAVYVFYLPAVLAIAVAFKHQQAAAYAGGAILLYATVALSSNVTTVTADQVQDLVVRVLMIVAVTFTGALFRHIEEERIEGRGQPFAFLGGRPREVRNAQPTNSAEVVYEGVE